MAAAAKADYLLFVGRDPTTGALAIYKTANGTSWSAIASSITAGHQAVDYAAGVDRFELSYQKPKDDAATQPLEWTELNPDDDSLLTESALSDTNGTHSRLRVVDSTLHIIYRGTGSPTSIRHDSKTLSGDSTPPGAATSLTVVWADDDTLHWTFVTPSADDAREYKLVRKTGSNPTSDSDGTTVVDWTAIPSPYVDQTIEGDDATGTQGTRYYYGVFLRDAAENVGAGAFANDVFVAKLEEEDPISAVELPASSLGPFRWATAAANFESGKDVGFQFQLTQAFEGVDPDWDSAAVFADSTVDRTGFEYESSPGTWAALPSNGKLTVANVGKDVRYTLAAARTPGAAEWRVRAVQ
jgi:hypothetical protein